MALPNLFCIFAAINVKHSNYMGKFIDPRSDWAFKYIFGREDTKECLITFLNGLFEGEFVIKDVKFEKTELLGMRKDDRGVIFDVYCTTTDGRRIIVEMQNKEQEFFVDRALFYSAQTIIGHQDIPHRLGIMQSQDWQANIGETQNHLFATSPIYQKKRGRMRHYI